MSKPAPLVDQILDRQIRAQGDLVLIAIGDPVAMSLHPLLYRQLALFRDQPGNRLSAPSDRYLLSRRDAIEQLGETSLCLGDGEVIVARRHHRFLASTNESISCGLRARDQLAH